MATSERPDRGVYGITTTAELAGVAVPTLRLYERRGLVDPTRTSGGTRRYSQDDLALLGRIGALVADGVNLTGVAHILALQARNTTLTTTNEKLIHENARLRAERETTMTTSTDEVTEHDRLDQLTPVDPDAAAPDEMATPPTDRWDADPTDIAEQATPVALDDDAYPHAEANDTDILPA